jgi:hypothetical protein
MTARAHVRCALAAALLLVLGVVTTGCARLAPYRTPGDVACWQDPSPPALTLAQKARVYQERVERRHQYPDGTIRYKRPVDEAAAATYHDLPDGSFFLGIYLASQALRLAVTGDPAAREQVLLTLRGMRLLAEVSGERGLLARYVSSQVPVAAAAPWRASTTHPGLFWRADVSKDQYAGFVHGLGVTWAVLDDPEIRAAVAPLAAAVADHLIEHDLQIVDWHGRRTRHGNLRARHLGVPLGVNALIALAAAKTAAVATGEARHRAFYERLVAEGYPEAAVQAHFSFLGLGNRDNDHMAYLSLYPLLLLEEDPEVAATLRRGARRSWRSLGDERNAFFGFVHAALVGDAPRGRGDDPVAREEGRSQGLRGLREFPDEKLAWPVDLTRPGFDFPRAFWNSSRREPRSRRVVPVHLRVRDSNLWTTDPRRLVGRLHNHGDLEFSGIDYLVAYWMGRHHGLVPSDPGHSQAARSAARSEPEVSERQSGW